MSRREKYGRRWKRQGMAWHKSRGEKERDGKRRKKKREQKRSKVGGTKMGRKDEEIGNT